MPPQSDDSDDLLERLGHDLPEDELLSLCGLLADRLLREGWTAEASRWRTLSLVPSSIDERREALEMASRRLATQAPGASPDTLTPAHLPPAWRDLLQQLRERPGEAVPPSLLRAALAGEAPVEAVQLGMADLCLALDHDGAAEQLLRKLLTRAGLEPPARNRLGVTAFRRGDHGQAERWFRSSLRQNVAQAVVWFELSRVLRLQRQHDEALEAAEAGLRYEPAHPWGLKLRTRILLEVGGWQTLAVLADYGALPDDGALLTACSRSPLERRLAWRRPLPPPPGLAQRLSLRQRLATVGRLDVIFGRSLTPLVWARAHDLLPIGLSVQPWASRDPVAVRERLEEEGYVPERERGLWSADRATVQEETADRSRLVLLERPRDRLLPRHLLEGWLHDSWVVQPVGLTVPGHPEQRVLQSYGWELLAPRIDG